MKVQQQPIPFLVATEEENRSSPGCPPLQPPLPQQNVPVLQVLLGLREHTLHHSAILSPAKAGSKYG